VVPQRLPVLEEVESPVRCWKLWEPPLGPLEPQQETLLLEQNSAAQPYPRSSNSAQAQPVPVSVSISCIRSKEESLQELSLLQKPGIFHAWVSPFGSLLFVRNLLAPVSLLQLTTLPTGDNNFSTDRIDRREESD